MVAKADFLSLFYKVFAVCGLSGSLIAMAWGWSAGFSFALGFGTMALIFFLWDLTLRHTLKPRKASWAAESMLVFFRYILLGGLFYVMISLFVVRWAFYLAGTTTMILSLLITAYLQPD